MKRIVVFGATSLIAQEAAKAFAEGHAAFFLVGRQAQKLNAVKGDLISRGATQVEVLPADLAAIDRHQEIVGAALRSLSQVDACLIAHGDNGNQQEGERNPQEALNKLTQECVHITFGSKIWQNVL